MVEHINVFVSDSDEPPKYYDASKGTHVSVPANASSQVILYVLRTAQKPPRCNSVQKKKAMKRDMM